MALTVMGLFGATLLYSDGMITPAITVLGAVEGLEVAMPSLHRFVEPIAVIILIGVTGFVMDQILSWLHGLFFPWAGTSGPLSRGIVNALKWPVQAISRKSPAQP